MSTVGYEKLRESLRLSAFPLRRPAKIKPVTRVQDNGDHLAVPGNVAPGTENPLEHVLFALKHEGVNLQVLAEAIPKLEPEEIKSLIESSPTSRPARIVCFLWEYFSKGDLPVSYEPRGNYVDLFPRDEYVTGKETRIPKWRVMFNGLGSLNYCPTVRRTPAIAAGLSGNVLGRAQEFMEGLNTELLERTINWAYLSETENSFAIEKEKASEGKAKAFVRLLRQAHDQRPLSEEYLVELQNAAVNSPFVGAASFRGQQNWLSNGPNGAASVTYIPPPTADISLIMDELMAFGNDTSSNVDDIIRASVLKFGFVFAHPFMDGNGRLSRFLFHYAVCQSSLMQKGYLLPVSVAMHNNETRYLETLKTFSNPARELWKVTWHGDSNYDMSFEGSSAVYRYWDATPCAEFGFAMAELALEKELRDESEFLRKYDALYRAANDEFNVRGTDLATLVAGVLTNGGVVSNNKRKAYADRVPSELFDYLELHSPVSSPIATQGVM